MSVVVLFPVVPSKSVSADVKKSPSVLQEENRV